MSAHVHNWLVNEDWNGGPSPYAILQCGSCNRVIDPVRDYLASPEAEAALTRLLPFGPVTGTYRAEQARAILAALPDGIRERVEALFNRSMALSGEKPNDEDDAAFTARQDRARALLASEDES